MTNLLKAADVMAETLRTFADMADSYDPPEDDDGTEAWNHRFCIGDLRHAREALSAYEAAKREAEVHPSMVDRLSIMNDDIAPAGKANVGKSRPIP